MAQVISLAVVLALLLVCACTAADGHIASRRLNSPYPKSGSSSSPETSSSTSPYPKSSGSSPSPDTSSTSPYPKSSGSSPSPDTETPSPDTETPSPDTDTSSPSPVTIPPVTSSPTGGYGGYGKHTGCGTPKFWLGNPGRIPKLLSLLGSLAKLFGPRILGLVAHKSVLGAIKDESPEAFPSLAREGATSFINAHAYQDFPLSAMDVVNQLNSALDSPDLAHEQALKFQRLNEAL